MKLLIVTPLPEERDGFLRRCRQLGLEMRTGELGRLPVTVLPELGVTLAVGGVGKAQYALQTQHLLDAGEGWEAVICAGTAGALADELAIGDVVVATTTLEHDYANRMVQVPRPRFDSDRALLASLRRVPVNGHGFDVHFGLIASGDEDIASAERRAELRRDTHALAAAWEGAGGARACAFCRVPYVEVRGISDSANADAARHFFAHLATAMQNVAQLVVNWLPHLRRTTA
jgi:adenosylhomocysteine nucleosidase